MSDDIVPIPLPPEPPRDRIIEAVDANGAVSESWIYSREAFSWIDTASGEPWHWEDIPWSIYSFARHTGVMRTLRHVPAEDGA